MGQDLESRKVGGSVPGTGGIANNLEISTVCVNSWTGRPKGRADIEMKFNTSPNDPTTA